MSDLPVGAVLTSINGRKCTAIPRNVTDPEDVVTATNPAAADPSESATSRLPPGGILMEAPGLSQEVPSLAPSFITSAPNAEPSETQPDTAASTPPGFRVAPGDEDESDDGVEEEDGEDPAATEALEDLPTDAPLSDDPLLDEDDPEEEPAATSEGSIEGTVLPEEPAQEEDGGTSVPTSAPGIVENDATQTAGSPEATDNVGSGSGGNEDDNEDSEETGEADSDNDSDNNDSNESGSEDGGGNSDSEDPDTEDSDDPNDSDADGDNNGNDESEDGEDGFGGAGADPSGTGGDLITTTLEGGVVTTIPAPSGNDQGSPTDNPDTDVVGSASGNGEEESKQAGIIAGSVVGSLAAVALVGFLLFWFWRKRSQRHKYVIQTPVFEPPNSSRTEKTWDFDNGSIGPTNKAARMKEAVEYRFDAIGRKFNKTSPQPNRKSGVNVNRGNSQFFAAGALPPRSRDNPDIHPGNDELSNQDRLGNWWSRVREDANFNWGVRNDSSEPADRAGQNRGFNHRASEGQDFSGTLGLMINDARSRGNDPFSDDYAQPGPSEGYAVHQTPPLRNPFDDANSIQPLPLAATSYDSRGHQRRSTTGSVHRQTRSPLRQQTSSPYQRSDTTTPLSRHQNSTPLSRGAVRSDQFDLEFEPHPGTLVAMPEDVTTREGTREGSLRSFTSQVSSLSDWDNNRGNLRGDVGAAALNWADEKSPGIGKAK